MQDDSNTYYKQLSNALLHGLELLLPDWTKNNNKNVKACIISQKDCEFLIKIYNVAKKNETISNSK